MKYSGDSIKKLIPQRHPFMMVDEIETDGGTKAVSVLGIRADNYFRLPDDSIAETGLIEHIAQSCSALLGCQALAAQAERPPVGLIGEVKHFSCLRRPQVGECVVTTVEFGFSYGSVTLANGESRVGDSVIATAKLKLFMQQ